LGTNGGFLGTNGGFLGTKQAILTYRAPLHFLNFDKNPKKNGVFLGEIHVGLDSSFNFIPN
jgi:hypothetical protein